MPTNAKKIRIGGVSHDIEDTAARTSIGTLSSLKTTEKTSLVSAVNEVFDSVDGLGETYAKQDGYYQDMTVGDAEQLVSSMVVNDSVPYKFRTSGGSADIGNRAYMDKIVGGTVAWNQQAKNSRAPTSRAGVTISGADDSFTLNGTASEAISATGWFGFDANQSQFASHKFLVSFNKLSGTVENIVNIYFTIIDAGVFNARCNLGNTVVVQMGSTVVNSSFVVSANTVFTNAKFRIQAFDLTQMFGSAVADYIYSLEQSTAGAGVAFFRSLFPNSYYAYNAGELISVSGLSSHDTVGFNAWDEEWANGYFNADTGAFVESATNAAIASKNYIHVIGGQTYCIKQPTNNNPQVYQYDADHNFISRQSGIAKVNGTFTVDSGCCYIKFICFDYGAGRYNNDICINLSHSGARNGEYESYKKHSYPLDSSLTLRGVPKLDSSNNLYWDGDEYAPDGTVTRRYGILDLGAISWLKHNDGYFFSNAIFDTGAANSRSINSIGLADRDIHPKDCLYVGWHATIYCFYADASTTAELKEAFRGKYLVYELATPTTETADAYQQIQNVDDYGTEEFVSTSIVPVGHVTRYPANLRDKLQHLPDLAASNGTYVILQSGSQMTLAPLTTPTELPAAPSTDGTYTLKATVSSGAVTYSWGA